MQYPKVTDMPNENSYFLVFNLTNDKEGRDKVVSLCNNLSGLLRSMCLRFPKLEVSCIMGFGADAWERLFSQAGRPRELTTFQAIEGSEFTAVSTPGDIFFHIRALSVSVCYELGSIISQALEGAATCHALETM